ncbi:MAG: hypothetical protein C0518_09370 [Opitutus sp.]|nr:hypothetical protein [Opitutus sp.]
MPTLPRFPRCFPREFAARGAPWLAAALLAFGFATNAQALPLRAEKESTIATYRHELPKTVRANHPAITPVADAIRAVTKNPLEQLVMVNDVTHLLVDFDEDWRVYGREEYHATLDEMIQNRRENGWLYLRDDCDGRSVFAAHLLAALGIEWRFEASRVKAHAWIVATVGGKEYDLLDYQPEGAPVNTAYYKMWSWTLRDPVHPPLFEWRREWAKRTGFDVGVGVMLGLLAPDSTRDNLRERRSTDWAKLSPKTPTTPPDERALALSVAGFPLGESLQPMLSSAPAIGSADSAAAPVRAPLGSN